MRARRSSSRRSDGFRIGKPNGKINGRVQAVGPEHFGIVSVDCAKGRSKYFLADFYGQVLVPPTPVEHTRGALEAAVARLRQTLADHALHDGIIAIERTGEYHRPVQRAFRQTGWETRLVDPLASKCYRQPADPGNKTDDTDLAAIFRAAVNGFGLIEPPLPEPFEPLRLLIRHRRDLVRKAAGLRCQIRECVHATLPGYAECFDDLFDSVAALPIARAVASADALRRLDAAELSRLVAPARCLAPTAAKVRAWAETAAPGHPLADLHRRRLIDLDDDRRSKLEQIRRLERDIARQLVQTPFVLLLTIPGIHVVSAADLAGEMGPLPHYASANAITGRAGLFPSRYQSDRVDHADGPLVRRGNRRLRAALLQIADNLVACNHHFGAQAVLLQGRGKDPRAIRVKVAKTFTRLAYRLVGGQPIFRHPCCQPRGLVLEKLIAFHHEHQTPAPQLLADLEAAVAQLPGADRPAEAETLAQTLQRLQRRRGPVPLAEILPQVLARLGVGQLQSDGGTGPGGPQVGTDNAL